MVQCAELQTARKASDGNLTIPGDETMGNTLLSG